MRLHLTPRRLIYVVVGGIGLNFVVSHFAGWIVRPRPWPFHTAPAPPYWVRRAVGDMPIAKTDDFCSYRTATMQNGAWIAPNPDAGMRRDVMRSRWGWPLLSFESRWVRDVPIGHIDYHSPLEMELHRGGVCWLSAPEWVPDWVPRSFKFRPVWPGFILNTFMYGAVAWVFAVHLPVWSRRCKAQLRLKSGRCPSCEYDLVGLKAARECPECGALLVSPDSWSAPEAPQGGEKR